VKLRLSVSTSHSGSSIDLSLDEARQLASTLVKAIERSTDVIAKVAEIERQRAALSERERSEIEELMS
jgi:hypothetical protein